MVGDVPGADNLEDVQDLKAVLFAEQKEVSSRAATLAYEVYAPYHLHASSSLQLVHRLSSNAASFQCKSPVIPHLVLCLLQMLERQPNEAARHALQFPFGVWLADYFDICAGAGHVLHWALHMPVCHMASLTCV